MALNETTADLTVAGGKIRLYVTTDLAKGMTVPLSEGHAHYLLHVMRAGQGDRLRLFNGRDGEWLAEIAQTSKRGIALMVLGQTAPQVEVRDIWLAFAPVKKVPAIIWCRRRRSWAWPDSCRYSPAAQL